MSEETLGGASFLQGCAQSGALLSAGGAAGDSIGELMHRTDLLLRRSAQQEEELSRLAGLVGAGGNSAPSQFNAIAERIDCIATALAHLDGGMQDALERERQNREVLKKALTQRLAQEVTDRKQSFTWLAKKLEGKTVNLEDGMGTDFEKTFFEKSLKGGFGIQIPVAAGTPIVSVGVPASCRTGSPVALRASGFTSPLQSARKHQSPLVSSAIRRESGTLPPTLAMAGVSEGTAGTPQWSPRPYGDRGAHMPASVPTCSPHSPRLSSRELGAPKVVRMMSQPQAGQSHLVGMPCQQAQVAVVVTSATAQTGPNVVGGCNSSAALTRMFSTPYDGGGMSVPFSPQVRQRAVRLSTAPGSPNQAGPR